MTFSGGQQATPNDNQPPKSDATQPVQDTKVTAQSQANSTMLREVNNAGETSGSSPEAFLSEGSVFTNRQPGSTARNVADDASKGAGVGRPQDATFGNMQGTYSRGNDLFTNKEGERFRVTQKPDNSYELTNLRDKSKVSVSQTETKFNTSDINAPGGSRGPATVRQVETGGARQDQPQQVSEVEARIQAAKSRTEAVRTAANEGGDPRSAYRQGEQQLDRTTTNRGTTEGGTQSRAGTESGQGQQNRQTAEAGQQRGDQQARTTGDGASRTVNDGQSRAEQIRTAIANGADANTLRTIYAQGNNDGTSQARSLTSGQRQQEGGQPRPQGGDNQTRLQQGDNQTRRQGGDNQTGLQGENQARLQGDGQNRGQNEGLRRNAGGETTTGGTTQPRNEGAALAAELKQARANGASPDELRRIYQQGSTTDGGTSRRTTTEGARTTTNEGTEQGRRNQGRAEGTEQNRLAQSTGNDTNRRVGGATDGADTGRRNPNLDGSDAGRRTTSEPRVQQPTTDQSTGQQPRRGNLSESLSSSNLSQEQRRTFNDNLQNLSSEQRRNLMRMPEDQQKSAIQDMTNRGFDANQFGKNRGQTESATARPETQRPANERPANERPNQNQGQNQGDRSGQRQGQTQGQTELSPAQQRIEQAKARTDALRASLDTQQQGVQPGQRRGDGGGQDTQLPRQDRSAQEIAANRRGESQATQLDRRGQNQGPEQKPADVKPADFKPTDQTRGNRFADSVNGLSDPQRQNFQNNFGKLSEQQQRNLQDLDGRQQQRMIERLAGDRTDINRVGRMIEGVSDAQQRRFNGQENRGLENQLANLEQRRVNRGPDGTSQEQGQNKGRNFDVKELDPRTMERLRQTMDGGSDGKLNRGDMERLAKLNPEFREAMKNPEFRKAFEGSEGRRGEGLEGKGQFEGRDGRDGRRGEGDGKAGSNQLVDGKLVDGKLVGKEGGNAQFDVKGQLLDGKAGDRGAVDAQGRPIDQLLRGLQRGETFKIPGLDVNDPQTKQFLTDAAKRLDNIKLNSPDAGSMKLQDVFKGLDVQKSTALQNFLTKGLDASGQPLTVAQLDQTRLDMLKTLLTQPDGGQKTLADSTTVTKNALQMLVQNQKGDVFASTDGAHSGLNNIGKMLGDMNRQFVSDTGKPIQLNDIANRNLIDSSSTDARTNYQRMQGGDLTAKMTPQQDQLVRNLLENSSRLVNALEAGRIANNAIRGTDGSIARADIVGPGRSDTATGRPDVALPVIPRSDMAGRPGGTAYGDGGSADAAAKQMMQKGDATAPNTGSDFAAKVPASRGDTASAGMSVADNIGRMPIDATTGLPYDPYSGKLLDPSTGLPIGDRSGEGVKKTATARGDDDWKESDKDRKKNEKLEGDEEKAEKAKQKAMLLMFQAKQKRDQELREKELKEKKRKEEEGQRSQYVCRDGDTIESIASKVVKDPRCAPLIYQINKEIIPVTRNILGKEIVNLHAGLTLWLPSPAEIREFKTALMSEQIDRGEGGKKGPGKFASPEEELAAKFGSNWSGGVDQSKVDGATAEGTTQVAETYAPNSIELELMTSALAETKKRKENIEKALGPIVPSGNKYKTASERTNYVIRLGDSLKSIASKHPALNDVSLWKLLAEVNELQPEARLTRGTSMLIPSKQDIQEYKERLGLTKADKFKKTVENLPDEIRLKTCSTCSATNVTRSTLCPNCGDEYIDQVEEAEPVDAGRLVLEAAGMVAPRLAPVKGEVSEPTNDVPAPPGEVAVITQFQVPEVKAPISGIRTTSTESSNSREEQEQTVAVQPIAWLAVKQLDSDTSLVKSADSWTAAQEADTAFYIRLQVMVNGELQPIVEYEIHKGKTLRHNFSRDGSSRSVTIDLPAQAATEMAQNDLSKNWDTYKAKFGN